MKKSKLVLFVFAIAVLFSGLWGVRGLLRGHSPINSAHAGPCQKDTANCFPDIALIDTDNQAWTKESLQDHIVIVNFWAHWCGPCTKEIPDLSKLHQNFGDKKVVVLGMQRDHRNLDHLQSFAKHAGLHYPVVIVDDEIAGHFGYPDRLPTTFIYDREGKLSQSILGPVTYDQLAQRIAPLL